MNFCKFYNKIINSLNEINVSIIDEAPHENKKEINIIFGIIYIIFCIIATFIVAISITIFKVTIFIVSNIIKILVKILYFTNKYTISKCDINKEE